MKMPVTVEQVIQIMRDADAEGRLSISFGWASWDRVGVGPAEFRGCLVGNVLRDLTTVKNKPSPPRQAGAVIDAVRDVVERGGSEADPLVLDVLMYNPRSVDQLVAAGMYLRALSCCYEGSDGNVGKTAARIRKHFPRRFMIDVDGLKAAVARGGKRKKPSKPAGKRAR